jgi:hypothetical protein
VVWRKVYENSLSFLTYGETIVRHDKSLTERMTFGETFMDEDTRAKLFDSRRFVILHSILRAWPSISRGMFRLTVRILPTKDSILA